MKNTVVNYPLTKQPKSKKKYHHYTFKQIRVHKHIHVQGIDHNQLKVSLKGQKPEKDGFRFNPTKYTIVNYPLTKQPKSHIEIIFIIPSSIRLCKHTCMQSHS